MRPISYAAVFVSHIVVGISVLTPVASATTQLVFTDVTLTSDVMGDAGADGAPDAAGDSGVAGVIWIAPLVDVVVDAGVTITGGKGGNGGIDASNDGGDSAGFAGAGLDISYNSGTLSTGLGTSIFGGAGGFGGDGGGGGANDTVGGGGGAGGVGILANATGLVLNLSDTIVMGGSGGAGGKAGDAGGGALAKGGTGGAGGEGIFVSFGASGTSITLTNTAVTGGAGGKGGTSLANATNAAGGNGAAGILDIGLNTTISIDANSSVSGGLGGTPGGGGSGGFVGSGGAGVLLAGVGASLTNHGAISGGAPEFDYSAVYVSGDTALVDNYGTITGAPAQAVVVNGNATLGMLHNRAGGFIESTNGASSTVGIYGTLDAFLNEGAIASSGTGAAVGLYNTVGTFVNAGSILAKAGPALEVNAQIASGLVDNTGGAITSDSAMNATLKLLADAGGSGLIIQGGEIQNLSLGNSVAIEIAGAQSAALTIKDLLVNGQILFSNDDETLAVVSSTLDGMVAFANGANMLVFQPGGSGTTTINAGAFLEAKGTLSVDIATGANVISNAAQSNANSAIWALTMESGGELLLNEDFHADYKVVNGGFIEIAAGKTLSSSARVFPSEGPIGV